MNYKDKVQMAKLYEQKNTNEQFKRFVGSLPIRQQAIIAEKMWNQLDEQQKIAVLKEGNFFKDMGQKIGGLASKAAPYLGTVSPLLGAAAGAAGGALSGKGDTLQNTANGAIQGGMGMLGKTSGLSNLAAGAGGLVGKGNSPTGADAGIQATTDPKEMAKAMFGQLMQNATPDLMTKLFDQLTSKLGGADKLAQIVQSVASPSGAPAAGTASAGTSIQSPGGVAKTATA